MHEGEQTHNHILGDPPTITIVMSPFALQNKSPMEKHKEKLQSRVLPLYKR